MSSSSVRWSMTASKVLVDSFDEAKGAMPRNEAVRQAMRMYTWMMAEAPPSLAALVREAALNPNGRPEHFAEAWVEEGCPVKARPTYMAEQLSLFGCDTVDNKGFEL